MGARARRDDDRDRGVRRQGRAGEGQRLRAYDRLLRENFVDRVKELTGGAGVPVVYDSVGKDTFPASLDCLAPLGMFVSFGASSGPVPPFAISMLQQRGSLFATRPTLFTYAAKRANLLAMADELFSLVLAGKIVSEAKQTFPLADAAAAHRALESRKTVGATVLIP